MKWWQVLRRPVGELEQELIKEARARVGDLNGPKKRGHSCLRSLARAGVSIVCKAHRKGSSGRKVTRALSYLADLLIAASFHIVGGIDSLKKGLAAVATGGYGREELCPCSDVDLLILSEASTDSVASLVSSLFEESLIYDLVPHVSPVIQNITEAVSVAKKDFRYLTALLDSRLIFGDRTVHEEAVSQVRKQCLEHLLDEYVCFRINDQARRRAQFGEAYATQEPHIKSGAGGLRDYHDVVWLTDCLFGRRDLRFWVEVGVLNEQELMELERAYDWLLKLRCELHFLCNCRQERLRRDLWPRVAWNLGFKDRSLALRIERLMSRHFEAARSVYYYTRRIRQEALAVSSVGRAPTMGSSGFETKVRRFIIRPNGIFSSRGVQSMTAFDAVYLFRLSQEWDVELSPALEAAVHRLCLSSTFTRELRRSEDAVRIFIEILRHRGNIGRALRSMYMTGVLSALVPEIEKISSLVQLEFYHLHAVDEHTLTALEVLDRIDREGKSVWGEFAELYWSIARVELLHLALLLHDVGRGFVRKDHVRASALVAARVVRRLCLDPIGAEAVRWLVEHHLDLIRIAQSQDITDPGVVAKIAQLVGNEEYLKMLTVLTVADTVATSPTLWNGYRQELLSQLYRRVARELSGKAPSVHKIRELLERRVTGLARGAIAKDEVAEFLNRFPERYLFMRTPAEVFADLLLVKKYGDSLWAKEQALVDWLDRPEYGYAQLKVASADRPGLFRAIVTALVVSDLNVLEAELLTTVDGIALDTFHVVDIHTGFVPSRLQRCRFQQRLAECLTGKGEVYRSAINKRSCRPVHRIVLQSLDVRVRWVNEPSSSFTLLELQAPDFPGLLLTVANFLAERQIDVHFARMSTDGWTVWDVFHVTDSAHNRIEDPARLSCLEKQLIEAIQQRLEVLRSTTV